MRRCMCRLVLGTVVEAPNRIFTRADRHTRMLFFVSGITNTGLLWIKATEIDHSLAHETWCPFRDA
jgi:hypothetical protein